MCGIVGSNFTPNTNPNLLLQTMQNRGPDSQNYTFINDHFFGHRRLSIIDSKNIHANQPMVFDDIVIVFNGTIYNYQELNKTENLQCITNSDTETILRLYQKYNTEFLNMLNGGFSFCIYDIKKEQFFCARDRYGKKPFFYYHQNGQFIFSSLIKPILQILQTTPKISKIGLNQYLQYFVPIETNTIYQDIYKLEAGYYLVYNSSSNSIFTKKYYKINTKKEIFDTDLAIDLIHKNLQDSISQRVIGDEKIATLLSGGVDSSLVSAMYAKISQNNINTFSIGYDEYKKYDELKFAKIVSKHINSNHTEILLSKNEFIENIDESIDILGQPHGDSAAIPLQILSQTINQMGFKVVLSGEGSDELFLGYPTYANMNKYHNFQTSLTTYQKDFLNTIVQSLQNNTKESEYLKRVVKNDPLYQSFGEIFNDSQKSKLLHKPYFFRHDTKNDFINHMSLLDLKIWLGDALLSKVDGITSHNAIEARTPFLDFYLVDNVFKIDTKIKLGNESKHIIKQIAKNYLPLEIVYRSKKGFSNPSNEWIHTEYGDEILKLILKVNNECNFFKDDYINFIYTQSKSGKFRQHLWSLYIFARWFNKTYL